MCSERELCSLSINDTVEVTVRLLSQEGFFHSAALSASVDRCEHGLHDGNTPRFFLSRLFP